MLKYHSLRDKVFRLENLYSAFRHVKNNKGKAGLDRVSIKQFEADLDTNIMHIHKELKTAIYKPSPVLRVYIPKGRHEKRPLGIPIVKDRIVQQAISPRMNLSGAIFEKDFSDNSFGFRPNRCCHDAIKRVEQYKQEGYRYILDADIKAFYDTIPHKLIMKRLCEKIADGLVLTSPRMNLSGVGLKLSEDKTKLTNFKRGFRFLGYNFINKYKGISAKSRDKLKDTIRVITRRTQGVNLKAVIGNLNPVIRGHVNYFWLGNVQKVYRQLDSWVRVRLRCPR